MFGHFLNKATPSITLLVAPFARINTGGETTRECAKPNDIYWYPLLFNTPNGIFNRSSNRTDVQLEKPS